MPSSANTTHITIDGDINEAEWKSALNISLGIVNNPWDNRLSPVKTQAKIIENGEYIYIAFIADDPNPEEILGFLGDRDSRWDDDLVGINLDTSNNRRLNYSFFVNPSGVQHDSIYNEMNGEDNTSWDGIWQANAKITPQGYQVEMAIPIRVLNFDDSISEKTWAIELVRYYPRDARLRISHLPLDKDNPCWLCQATEIKGFTQAKNSHDLMLTPSLVISDEKNKDVYAPNSPWHEDTSVKTSLDIRWGINANNTVNATLNPDFSNIETDEGQLSVNKTFSLFYEEKRPFFLENMDYFTNEFDLVYTRNIIQPDYGAKLTGSNNKHNYGIFISNDRETNFIVPGNTGSDIASLDEESHSGAIKYRYDFNEDFYIGAINTFRAANDYHNLVIGSDSQYRINNSNTLNAQALYSSTQYPKALYQDFCFDDICQKSLSSPCQFGSCEYGESIKRTLYDDEITDAAYKVNFIHDSKYWALDIMHQYIGDKFRADLGFMPYTDYQHDTIKIERKFYSDPHSLWEEAYIEGEWGIEHNANGELISRSLTSFVGISGPLLSYIDIGYTYANRVGLRHNETSLAIDNNTSRFNEKYLELYSAIQATKNINTELNIIAGDKIDYRNDRLGDYYQIESNTRYNLLDNLELKTILSYEEMNADNHYVYRANLAEIRIAYQFNLESYLRLHLVYTDVTNNLSNNPYVTLSHTNTDVSTQLTYAYKLNPQTVFYLGYSDYRIEDDYLNSLEQNQRTFYSKISYAWLP